MLHLRQGLDRQAGALKEGLGLIADQAPVPIVVCLPEELVHLSISQPIHLCIRWRSKGKALQLVCTEQGARERFWGPGSSVCSEQVSHSSGQPLHCFLC